MDALWDQAKAVEKAAKGGQWDAAKTAAAKLKFCRIAFGAAGSAGALHSCFGLPAMAPLRSTRCSRRAPCSTRR